MFAMLFLIWNLVAFAEDPWLTLYGAGDLTWGTTAQPLDGVPRSRDLTLPDSGFIGMNTRDKPDDLEIPAPEGERRFLRYVGGALVDAWVVRHGPIPISEFSRIGDVEFTGPVLGPTVTREEQGWRAVGDATSWKVRDRTVLYWKDRASDLEILASRASPSGSYGVRREAPLAPGIPSSVRPTIKGDMNRWVKPRVAELSGCMENSTTPVTAEVDVRWDAAGRLSRMKANAGQPAAELTSCVAGAIADLPALPNQSGSFTITRML